jgi:hypothetical protein
MISWLGLSGIGCVLALLPIWWWFIDSIVDAVLNKKTKVPSWMFRIASQKTTSSKFIIKPGILGRPYSYIFSRTISIVYVVGFLLLFHFKYWDIITQGTTLSDIIYYESSFPLFLSLSFLLPICYIERYFRRLGKKVENET